MSNKARHPYAYNEHFKNQAQELWWAYGKPSSRDFQERAATNDRFAQISELQVRKYEQIAAACSELSSDMNQSEEMRTEAAGMADHVNKWILPRLRERLNQQQQQSAELRKMAEQAREFENRWSFDPYADPLRDSMQRGYTNCEGRQKPERKKAPREAT